SKSDGWYIDLDQFFEKYTTDQIRYYLAAIAPETSDSDFSWKDFQKKCNSDLVGKFGNFIHRTLTFAQNKCLSMVPKMGSLTESDQLFMDEIAKITEEAYHCFHSFKLKKATQCLMSLAQLGNSYFDSMKPWALAKSASSKPQMDTIIACCIECIKNMAIV